MRPLIILVLLALAGNLLATALPNLKVNLSATVITDEGAPLEYATVSALRPDSTLVDGTVTNTDGTFSLSLPKGNYVLRVEFLGFATTEVPVVLDGNLKLEDITLSAGGVELDAVEVRASKSQMSLQLDKKVFNVGADALAQGGSANEVLAQVPSVTVGATGNVSLRGNGSVRILINGRPSALADNNSLDAIPAASIESVEVITNPSARYEAAGTAGIINIILKKDSERGYGGSLRLGVGQPADFQGSLNLNYRHEKFNAFANLGGRYANFRGAGDLQRASTLNGETTTLDQIIRMDRNDKAWSAYTGFDYKLSDQATLTASYSVYDVINDDFTTTSYAYRSEDGSERNLEQGLDYLEPGTYQQIDVIYDKTFEQKGRKLSLYFNHDSWSEGENEWVDLQELAPNSQQLLGYNTFSGESSKDYLLRSDYVTPLGENSKLEMGIRLESRVISSDYFAKQGEDVILGFDNELDYFEEVGGAFMEYAYEKEAFGFQLGLRNEYTSIRVENTQESQEDIQKNYNQLFPSLSTSYKFNEVFSSQLSFSRRIRRPQFWQLSTFGGIRNPSVLFTGNPDLDPAYSNRVELNLMARWEKVTINPAIYASATTDYFQNVVEQSADNIFGFEDGTILSSPVNLDQETSYGLELFASYRPTEALNFSGDIHYYGYRQRGEFEERSFDFDFATWSGSLRAQVTLPLDIDLQARLAYSAPRKDAQSIQRANYYGTLGLSRRWSSKIMASFSVRAPRYQRSSQFRPSFVEENYFEWTGWTFGANVQYRFEKGAKADERRQRGSIR
ncbi:TonB-dependent receptor domain-containing protein [Neolewinella agarilytica]|uniref:TonB-dependent receptor domain-containing protein n=1 Tax=Neolewinella agarilytica TaxID=478744 RepID=UPI0023541A4A|nr:TonB-dependent receptor [Neolewinella agarilytica]